MCTYKLTHTHTQIYIYIYIYIYQYDTINEFILIHVQLCLNFTSHYHRAVLFMNRMAANAIVASMFYKASKQFIASILSF